MKTKPTIILAAALLCVLSPISSAKPLKVFILAGQSNMEGHAAIRTFDYIGKGPLTAPLLKEMRNPDGTPRVSLERASTTWDGSTVCSSKLGLSI